MAAIFSNHKSNLPLGTRRANFARQRFLSESYRPNADGDRACWLNWSIADHSVGQDLTIWRHHQTARIEEPLHLGSNMTELGDGS
jgi:hypothetical protein